MRVAFLNSCLEPGRDGVGDYTRSLAQECIRQGQQCCLVALNDRYVMEPIATETDGLQELRLPVTMPWPKRIRAAQTLLDAFAPDWVSLQFVSYGFHPKGFVHGLGRRLRPLLAGRRVHVMFHELWLGETRNAPIKHRLVGTVQKALVQQMLHQIKPQVVQTSISGYVDMLTDIGVQSTRLPMFGSIPIVERSNNDWLYAEIGKANIEISGANRTDFWLSGFFGALHPNWPAEPLMSYLGEAVDKAGRRLVLLSVGRMGEAGEALWAQMAARYSPNVSFVNLGLLPTRQVSEYLQSLDFGIAASPYSLIGKSSSAAAMLEHGLPVIVNRDDVRFFHGGEQLATEPLLHKMDKAFTPGVCLTRGTPSSRLPITVTTLLHDLAVQDDNR